MHAAAIPEPRGEVPHVVLQNNLMATFNVVEAAVRAGAARLVHVSSLAALGWSFPERPLLPDYLPADEEHPARAQDPYALSKLFGEQVCDAAVRRSDLRLPLAAPRVGADPRHLRAQPGLAGRRPHGAGAVALELRGPRRRRRRAARGGGERGCPATRSSTSPPSTIRAATTSRPRCVERYGDRVALRALPRPDCSAVDVTRAERLLGWAPSRSWREHLG